MAKKKVVATTDDVPETGWADSTARFSLDQLLRDHGFRVVDRPPGGRDKSVWRRGKNTCTFRQALREIDRQLVQDARYAEDMYLEGVEFLEGDG